MNETELESYKEKADNLIEHFNDLVLDVKNYLFPWKLKILDWFPETTKWPDWIKISFSLFIPLAFFDPDYYNLINSQSNPIILLTSVIGVIYLLGLFILGLSSLLIFFLPSSIITFLGRSSSNPWFTWFLIVFFIILGIMLYIQTFRYWFDQKTTWQSKSLYLLSILFTSMEYYLNRGFLIKTNTAINFSTDTYIYFFIFSSIFFWIPFILLSSYFFLNLAKILFIGIFGNIVFFVEGAFNRLFAFYKENNF